MRYMIIVKATRDSEAGVLPEDALIERMQQYHDELARAGMLVDASGLRPTSEGWRVRYEGERASVVDGPFTETKELIAGYTIIEARTREEALEWTRRFPNPAVDGGQGEIEAGAEAFLLVLVEVTRSGAQQRHLLHHDGLHHEAVRVDVLELLEQDVTPRETLLLQHEEWFGFDFRLELGLELTR